MAGDGNRLLEVIAELLLEASDEELLEVCRESGIDPAEVAKRMDNVMKSAIKDFKQTNNSGTEKPQKQENGEKNDRRKNRIGRIEKKSTVQTDQRNYIDQRGMPVCLSTCVRNARKQNVSGIIA
jgi:hypothetical protein